MYCDVGVMTSTNECIREKKKIMINYPAFTTFQNERVLTEHLFTGSIINIYFDVRCNVVGSTAEKPLTNVNSRTRSAANTLCTHIRTYNVNIANLPTLMCSD